jgi:hypothetical protein
MFANCSELKSAIDTNANTVEEGSLHSKDFFIDLISIKNTTGTDSNYPLNVFYGCTGISMEIDYEDGNPYLFHIKNANRQYKLGSGLYSGIKLIGELNSNVFGAVSNTIGDYYIPTFTSISSPFGNIITGELTMDIENISNMIGDYMTELVAPLQGVTITGNSKIPTDIFKDKSNLVSISGFFSGLDLSNGGEIFEFPSEDFFKGCTSLKDVSYLWYGNTNLKIHLLGEGFKDCALQNVSAMLSSTATFGYIPYRLFYMERNGEVKQTITNMTNLFDSCWNIGYTSDRSYKIGYSLKLDPEQSNTVLSRTTWTDHIVDNPGEEVPYSLGDYDETDEWYIDGYEDDEENSLFNSMSSSINAT